MNNKAILMSIRPQYVAKILNGEKTIEIRKRFPKDYVGWVYIYCTKGKPNIQQYLSLAGVGVIAEPIKPNYINGKVVARFWCDKVEEIKIDKGVMWRFGGHMYITDSIYDATKLLRYSCLEQYQLENYLQGKIGYAIHITKLEVFNKPKELKEFKSRHYPQFANMEKNTIHYELVSVNKAPQSWCYVEVD